MGQVRASHLSAGILALFLWCAPSVPANAGCTFDDFGDALSSAADAMQDLLSSPACLPWVGSPGFWFVAGSFTAGTASSDQIRGFCNDLQNFNTDSLKTKQEGLELYGRLPEGVRKALDDAFGGAVKVVDDINPVLAYASCACQVANSTGVAKVLDVGGACFKDALCWLDDALFGNSCDSGPQGITMIDCTRGVDANLEFRDDNGSGLYINVQGASSDGQPLGFACFCPKPMVLGGITYQKLTDCDGTKEDCRYCHCPSPSEAPAGNALGVCICPDGSPLQANGTCAKPCSGSCPADQIVKSAFQQANGVCVSQCICPPGQTMQDGVCQFPACVDGQTRIPGGKCCAKTQVSACGQCCGPRQIPDEVSGSCMEDVREKKEPNRLPKPAMTPSRALFSPSAR
jgi:hypothetical protein